MEYTEKDIEEELIDYPGLLKQLNINPLGNQVIVEHGIIDILAYDPSDSNLVVIEIKKGIVDESAVGQAMRYMADIISLKEWFCDGDNTDMPKELTGIQGVKILLMGSHATAGVEAITVKFPFIKFYPLDVRLSVSILPADPCTNTECSIKTIKSFHALEPRKQIVYAHELKEGGNERSQMD